MRSVLLHRPGDELKRLTPRNSADLLFDAIPWLAGAQDEHDAFADTLRSRGVEICYVTDLLVDVLDVPAAREELLAATVSPQLVGPSLAGALHERFADLPPAQLAEVLVAGLSVDELAPGDGLVARLAPPHQFVVPPLPNLLFTRDPSVVVNDRVALASPSMRVRRREAALIRALFRHHPRLAGTGLLYGDDDGEPFFEGGDVLLLAPGIVAVGVGQRTTPAGAEAFAQRLLGTGRVSAVLAVPVEQERATMHLDTVCTMVDVDAVVMYPPVANTLQAFTVTAAGIRGPAPFLEAAAAAMGIERLRVIETGLDPVTAEREQWDDGNNTLAVAPRVVVAYERNEQTNARLEAAGIEVLRIPGSELGSGRGGPRCMSCPLARDPGLATSP